MDFNSFHNVQTWRDARGPASQAPPGVAEEATRAGWLEGQAGGGSWARGAARHLARTGRVSQQIGCGSMV